MLATMLSNYVTQPFAPADGDFKTSVQADGIDRNATRKDHRSLPTS